MLLDAHRPNVAVSDPPVEEPVGVFGCGERDQEADE